MECSLPGSSVHGILQARILEWVAISFSRVSSQPRDQIQVSHIAGRRSTLDSLEKDKLGSFYCFWDCTQVLHLDSSVDYVGWFNWLMAYESRQYVAPGRDNFIFTLLSALWNLNNNTKCIISWNCWNICTVTVNEFLYDFPVVCVCHVRMFVTPWTVDNQAPLSMEFSRQKYRSGCCRESSQPRDQTQVSRRQILYHLSHRGSPPSCIVISNLGSLLFNVKYKFILRNFTLYKNTKLS